MYIITMFEDMGKIFVKYWDLFLIKGLSATIILSLMTVVLGTVFGALLALVKIGKIKPLKWIVNALVEIIRGTPMLLQLYISTFLIPVLIPLFVSAFKRAEELATAMECRCYRGDKNRTKLVKLEFRARDYLWFFIFAIFIAGVVCMSVLPYRAELDSLIFKILFYKI